MSATLSLPGLSDAAVAHAVNHAHVTRRACTVELLRGYHFRYMFECRSPRDRKAAVELLAERDKLLASGLSSKFSLRRYAKLRRELRAVRERSEVAWRNEFVNLVVTAGENAILTNNFAASAYTAAWYMGLISNTGFTAIAATDTMASHPGWTESAVYSNATRPAITFGTAASGTIATSSASVFNINGSDTIYGAFFVTNSTISGTTGTLYSAGEFSGGTTEVSSGDTLNCSASQAITA